MPAGPNVPTSSGNHCRVPLQELMNNRLQSYSSSSCRLRRPDKSGNSFTTQLTAARLCRPRQYRTPHLRSIRRL
jgi:hypothetical protein